MTTRVHTMRTSNEHKRITLNPYLFLYIYIARYGRKKWTVSASLCVCVYVLVCAVHLCVSVHKMVYDISWLWIDSLKSLATKCIYVLLDEYRRALKLYRIYILIIAHTILTDESIAQQWRRVNANENKIKSKSTKESPAEKKTIVLITFRLYFPLSLIYFDK